MAVIEIGGILAKRCKGCGVTKELDRFHSDASSKGGRSSHCADCRNARKRARRAGRELPPENQNRHVRHAGARRKEVTPEECCWACGAELGLEALRRDAERYRWLRDPCSGAERVVLYPRGDFGRGLMSHVMLDAAIDAAMLDAPGRQRRKGGAPEFEKASLLKETNVGYSDTSRPAPTGQEPDEERLAMEAVMESVDPATWPGLTVAQRCSLGRFAKPAKLDALAGQEPVATILPPDPLDERPGPWLSTEDWERLRTLPAGTKLYAAAPPAQLDASVLSILREARESVRYHQGMQNLGWEAGKRHAAELGSLIERIDAVLAGKGGGE